MPSTPKIEIEYLDVTVPAGAKLRVPYRGTTAPEVQVLDVERREGNGMAQWDHRFRVALIWR